MKYLTIKDYDIANGNGVRVSLFVSGCSHHCKGCFNPESWNFNNGYDFSDDTIDYILELMDHDYISGLTLLGGEPLESVNHYDLLKLVSKVKREFPDKDIWCYTGYLFDKDILDMMFFESNIIKDLISYIDVIVDGPFILEKKDLSLMFRGSSNQRIIDVRKSMKNYEIILHEKNDKRVGDL